MERAPRRPVKAHDGAPSRLVDPRRSGAVTQRPQGYGSNSARARVVAGVTRQRIVLRLVDLVDVSSLTSDGQCPGSRSLSEGAHVLASPRADWSHGRSTERHGGGLRHPLGAVPRLGTRGARPRDPMKTPRAKEGEAPPTVPSNVSWGRRSRRSPESRSHLARDSGATHPGLRSWRHSTAWKDATDSIPHSSPCCAGSRSLGLSRARSRPARDPPPNRKAAPPSRIQIVRKAGGEPLASGIALQDTR